MDDADRGDGDGIYCHDIYRRKDADGHAGVVDDYNGHRHGHESASPTPLAIPIQEFRWQARSDRINLMHSIGRLINTFDALGLL